MERWPPVRWEAASPLRRPNSPASASSGCALYADNVAIQHLMNTFAVRLEQRGQHDGVCEVVAELPGCGAAALAA